MLVLHRIPGNNRPNASAHVSIARWLGHIEYGSIRPYIEIDRILCIHLGCRCSFNLVEEMARSPKTLSEYRRRVPMKPRYWLPINALSKCKLAVRKLHFCVMYGNGCACPTALHTLIYYCFALVECVLANRHPMYKFTFVRPKSRLIFQDVDWL